MVYSIFNALPLFAVLALLWDKHVTPVNGDDDWHSGVVEGQRCVSKPEKGDHAAHCSRDDCEVYFGEFCELAPGVKPTSRCRVKDGEWDSGIYCTYDGCEATYPQHCELDPEVASPEDVERALKNGYPVYSGPSSGSSSGGGGSSSGGGGSSSGGHSGFTLDDYTVEDAKSDDYTYHEEPSSPDDHHHHVDSSADDHHHHVDSSADDHHHHVEPEKEPPVPPKPDSGDSYPKPPSSDVKPPSTSDPDFDEEAPAYRPPMWYGDASSSVREVVSSSFSASPTKTVTILAVGCLLLHQEVPVRV